jgi:hypothetical protein
VNSFLPAERAESAQPGQTVERTETPAHARPDPWLFGRFHGYEAHWRGM